MNAMTRQAYRIRLLALAGAAALLLCAAGAWVDPTAFFAAWLAAWWVCAGMVLGAQANLWLYGLTGGSWMKPIYLPLRLTAGTIPVLSLLLLPMIVAIPFLYPWAQPGWAAGLKSPGFKTVWLSPGFFISRLLAYLIIWNALIRISAHRLPGFGKGYSALGLLIFGYSISLAAVDLVMSLMPDWYSSGFGLVAVTTQMQAGFALAVFFGASTASPAQRRDLGNLMLMYVLMWAYLGFVQFQIIWAENLPDEIAWYVPRLLSGWQWLGVALVVGGFFLPLILLLFRAFKENGNWLRALAGFMSVMSFLESIWLVLPSINGLSMHVIWMCPLAVFGMGAVLYTYSVHARHKLGAPDDKYGENDVRTVKQ